VGDFESMLRGIWEFEDCLMSVSMYLRNYDGLHDVLLKLEYMRLVPSVLVTALGILMPEFAFCIRSQVSYLGSFPPSLTFSSPKLQFGGFS
jgi:hypothetical protein